MHVAAPARSGVRPGPERQKIFFREVPRTNRFRVDLRKTAQLCATARRSRPCCDCTRRALHRVEKRFASASFFCLRRVHAQCVFELRIFCGEPASGRDAVGARRSTLRHDGRGGSSASSRTNSPGTARPMPIAQSLLRSLRVTPQRVATPASRVAPVIVTACAEDPDARRGRRSPACEQTCTRLLEREHEFVPSSSRGAARSDLRLGGTFPICAWVHVRIGRQTPEHG
jgi:hypothetical protein